MADILKFLKDAARFIGVMIAGTCAVIGLIAGFLVGGLLLVIFLVGSILYILSVDPSD